MVQYSNLIGGTGDIYDVVAGETIRVGLAFDRDVTLIGGMDTDGDSNDSSISSGSATPGDVVDVSSVPEAESLFGKESELYRACRAAFQSPVSDVKALPVSETNTTKSVTSSSSASLGNTPLFDPDLHPDHAPGRDAGDGGLTITKDPGGSDTDVTVNVVYDSSPSTPSSSDTANVNPRNGEIEFDSSGDYDIQYSYGDYSESVLRKAADEGTRSIVLLHENTDIINELVGEIDENGNASEFIFQNAFAGVQPWTNTSNPDTANFDESTRFSFSEDVDNRRMALSANPIGQFKNGNNVRTAAFLGSYFASRDLGESISQEELPDLLDDLRTEFTPSEAGEILDNGTIPLLKESGRIDVLQDRNTSSTAKFERIHTVEKVDEVLEASHQINKNFLGEANTQSNRNSIKTRHVSTLKGFTNSSPPLLTDFSVTTSQNSNDDNQVDVELGIKPSPVIDEINVNVTVGDVITNQGAS